MAAVKLHDSKKTDRHHIWYYNDKGGKGVFLGAGAGFCGTRMPRLLGLGWIVLLKFLGWGFCKHWLKRLLLEDWSATYFSSRFVAPTTTTHTLEH